MKLSKVGLILLFILAFVCCFAACSKQDFSDSSQELKADSKDNTLVSCAQPGNFSCEIPPFQNLATDACAHLQNCLKGQHVGDLLVEQVLDCESPVFSVDSELGSAASVAARLEADGTVLHGSFLFVRFEEGWCPVDLLHEPTWNHGGYCETQPQLRWESGGIDSPLELYVESQRICYMPLDQEEIAAGESDIAMSECRQARYAVSGRRLTRLSEISIEGACPAK